MKKIAIVIGHTQDSQGACSEFGIPCEWTYNTKVASYLEDVADIYFHDTYRYGYSKMIEKTSEELNKHNYELVLLLHYNSAMPKANGTEVLFYHTNAKGGELAKDLCNRVCKAFGTQNRGAKGVDRHERGGYALYKPKATTLLIEPFFGSNSEDVSKFKNKEKEYANVLRNFFVEGF
ncbi:N-acetylmuramoyl-L-alanine amidase [Ornithobacterium rhinotracheale]|uniref:N-acetylmuramoyl-L-alanine amidase n=1 Tax=Ornithobacterium rhinotracheale TaxID=28251 RepID=UPI004036DC16